MRRFSVLFALLAGCPSSAPPPETTPEPEPEPGVVLDGQVLYEGTLTTIPQSVFGSWERFQEAWAAEPPMPPEGAGPQAYQRFATERFAPYVDTQVQAASQLLDGWEAASEPEEQLVHAVLAARLLHRSASWMWTLPMPDVGQVDEGARAALEQSIRGAAQQFADYAHSAFGKCVEAAGTIPELDAWRADCVRRAEAVAPIRVAELGPPPPTPMPEGCEGRGSVQFEGPGYDPESTPRLLVLVEAQTEGVDTARVQRAVERWARSEHGLRPLPMARRRAAERLVEAGRVSRGGVECVEPPSLTWVLGAQVPLVVAKVDQSCEVSETWEDGRRVGEPERSCGLDISWHRPGSHNREGLPSGSRRTLPLDPTTEQIVTSLTGESISRGELLGEYDGEQVQLSVRSAGEPRLRLYERFDDLGVRACQAERGASQLQLAWTIAPTGAVESVTVTGGDDAVNTCVQQKLEELTVTCTPGGEPIEMQTTLCLAR